MNGLKKINRGLCHCEELISSVAMLAMCVVVFIAVIFRFLNIAWAISDELARYLMVWCIYIGVIIATRERAHVGVEVFVNLFPKKIQKFLRILADFITLGTYIWLFRLTISWILGCMGPNPQLTPMMRIPYWMMYSAVAVAFGLSIIRQIQVMVSDHILAKNTGQNDNKEEEEVSQ